MFQHHIALDRFGLTLFQSSRPWSTERKLTKEGWWVNLEESTWTGVILRDFSPEEPALNEL